MIDTENVITGSVLSLIWGFAYLLGAAAWQSLTPAFAVGWSVVLVAGGAILTTFAMEEAQR